MKCFLLGLICFGLVVTNVFIGASLQGCSEDESASGDADVDGDTDSDGDGDTDGGGDSDSDSDSDGDGDSDSDSDSENNLPCTTETGVSENTVCMEPMGQGTTTPRCMAICDDLVEHPDSGCPSADHFCALIPLGDDNNYPDHGVCMMFDEDTDSEETSDCGDVDQPCCTENEDSDQDPVNSCNNDDLVMVNFQECMCYAKCRIGQCKAGSEDGYCSVGPGAPQGKGLCYNKKDYFPNSNQEANCTP